MTRNFLARVDANGVLDPAFDPGNTVINAVQSITLQLNGSLLVGENLSKSLNNSSTRPPSLIRVFAELPAVTLSAPKPNATEVTGKHGSFVLSRGGNASAASGPLTIYLELSGNALPGKKNDYLPLLLTQADSTTGAVTNIGRAKENGLYVVTFPTGVSSSKFKVIPTGHAFPPLVTDRMVTLTVVAAPTGTTMYSPGSTATVTITND